VAVGKAEYPAPYFMLAVPVAVTPAYFKVAVPLVAV
jgi:hypothetical protein